jgi:hypothetical protein
MIIVKLATYEGRTVTGAEDEKQLLWLSDKTLLGESVEGVSAKLLELKNNPYGIPLQPASDEAQQDTKLVNILDVYIDSFTQDVVARLELKETQTFVADNDVAEELIDESVADTFPASDPPALKSTGH